MFWQLSQKEGMPTNQIYDIFQDSEGNIWFGSDLGVFKHDGYQIKRFAPNEYAIEMSNLAEDPEGRIWANNFNGQIFYIENDSLNLFKDFSKLTKNYVNYSIHFFPKIVCSSANGLLILNFSDSSKISRIAVTPSKEKVDTRIGSYTYNNEILLQSGGYFLTINEQDEVTNILDNVSLVRGATPFQFMGKDYITFNSGEIRINPTLSGIEHIYPIPNQDYIYWSAVYPDTENEILMLGTKGGIVSLDTLLKPVLTSQKWLSGKAVSSILKSQEGSYWCSTLSDGICVLPNIKLLNWNEVNSSLLNNQVKAFAKDLDGNLLIGFFNGSIMRLKQNNEFETIGEFSNRSLEKLYFDSRTNRLYHNANQSDYFDFDKNKWGRELHSIYSFKHIAPLVDNWIISYPAATFILTPNHKNTYSPLEKTIIQQGLKAQREFHQGKQKQRFVIRQKKSMTSYFDEEHNNLWIGYIDGLHLYNSEKEVQIRKPNGEKIYAIAMKKDANGKLWISTSKGELLAFQDTSLVFDSQQTDWFQPQSVYGLAIAENKLAAATTNGLYIIETSTLDYQLINQADGLPNILVNAIAIAHKQIFLATFEGIFSLPLNYQHKNNTPPPIRISSFGVWEKDTLLNTEYVLPHNQNNIKIGFIGIAHRSRGSFKYQYRMQGLDNNWLTVPSNQNLVRYPSLPSGKFTFEVQAVNEDGVKSSSPATIQIEILKPLWMQWWFWLICGLAMISITVAIAWFRIRRLKREHRIKQKVKAVESELIKSNLVGLRAQMNPHFIFNALNSIQNFIYFNKRMLAVDYLSKFAQLMRLYLHQSKQEFITLKEELEALHLYLELEEKRFEDDLTYQVEVDKQLDIRNIPIPSMLVQPYVENAIKHGLLHKENGQKALKICFKRNQDLLHCQIEDNGVGRDASAEINQANRRKHQSFALSANQTRLDLLNYNSTHPIELVITDLKDAHGDASGTRVEIFIPIRDKES